MFIFKHVKDLRLFLARERNQPHSIGFVPTMGALHKGHIALINRAHEETDIVVCSIFVNPTQFNNQADLIKYPRPIEKDIQLLVKYGNNVLLLPDEAEIYPKNYEPPAINLGHLTSVMEGKFRPGHFEGVAQVVYRLLQITQPHRLYMGQKDYQQQVIIKSMIEQFSLQVKLITCATVREEDGLAFSSRNVRLSSAYRKKAPIIYQALSSVTNMLNKFSIHQIEKKCIALIDSKGLITEYFKIVDPETLQEVNLKNASKLVACTAAWAGDVRLIDNMIIEIPSV